MARPVKHTGLKEAIVKNEHLKGLPTYKTPHEIAREFNVSPEYVYQIRHRALNVTQYNISPRQATRLLGQGHTDAVRLISDKTPPDKLLEILDAIPEVGPRERIKVLSHLVRTAAPLVKIQAIKVLEELTRSSEQRVGPPAPLSAEDKIARLARLLMAVGDEIAAQAWETAYGYGIQRPTEEESLRPSLEAEETLRTDPDSLPKDAPEMWKPLPDLSPEELARTKPGCGSLPLDRSDPGNTLSSVQHGSGAVPGQPEAPPESPEVPQCEPNTQ